MFQLLGAMFLWLGIGVLWLIEQMLKPESVTYRSAVPYRPVWRPEDVHGARDRVIDQLAAEYDRTLAGMRRIAQQQVGDE